MTRTVVRYFSIYHTESLTAAIAELELSWNSRRQYVSASTRDEGDDRLKMVVLAVRRLTDIVVD